MNKEEILAKSRAENRGRDEADLDTERKGAWIVWPVAFIAVLTVGVIDLHVLRKADYGMLMVLGLAMCIWFFYKYRMLKKKHELLVAITYILWTLFFLTAWLLQLLKVW